MEKKRIYQVAKEFHVSSEALISMLKDSKYDVKSHMSVVNAEMYESIKKQFEKKQDEAKKEIKKKEQPVSQEKTKTSPKPAVKTTSERDEEKKPGEKRRKKKKRPSKQEQDTKEKIVKHTRDADREKDRKTRSKARKQRLQEHKAAVQDTFKKTMASLQDTKAKPKKSRAKAEKEIAEDGRPLLKVTEFMSVAELAKQMDMPASTLIQKCMAAGLMLNINQRLDLDTIVLLGEEMGYKVETLNEYAEDLLRQRDVEAHDQGDLKPRPPVVTVMGHVDHGKTSLLDYIRKTNVVSGESGGITQHIGAYSVKLPDERKITFIDTPGHEAFTAMRARGAKVTDIVILIVAADDSVKPQTLEAIDHARAAGVPIVIAVNKIDLAGADPEKVKGDLARHNVLVEDWGGTYQVQEISAKKGINIDKLLEKVLLEAEILELKENPEKLASGVVIDSKLDKGRGAVATILVQSGTLRVGDPFISGMTTGRVRAMFNEYGESVVSAGPSKPVQIFGMDGVPRAGESFYTLDSETEARDIAQNRRIMKREQDFRRVKRVSLNDVYDKIKDGTIRELKLIIKADVDGSAEALSDALSKIVHEEVRVKVIHQAVGGINENDVLLAAASGAIVIGFHVRPTPAAKSLADTENVEIKMYEIIYEAIEDVQNALSGLLKPKLTEVTVGAAEVRNLFRTPKAGQVAGCFVTSGSIKRNSKIRLVRDNIEIERTKISSLKRFKEDVAEVNQGYECGIGLDTSLELSIGDVIESFVIKEEARKI